MARSMIFQVAPHRTPVLVGVLAACLCLLGPRAAHAPDPPLQALAPFEIVAEDVRSPRYLAVDLKDRLIVSEAQPGQVLRIALDRTVTVLIDDLKDPEGLVVDPSGALFVAADRQRGSEGHGQSGVILRRDPQAGRLSVVANDFKQPKGLAREPDGTLLLSAQGRRGERDEKGALYTIEPSGQTALLIDAFKQPQGVVVAPDGTLFVAAEQFERRHDRVDGSLFQVAPTRQVTAVIPRRLKDPFGVARDPLDGLYVTGTQIRTPGPDLDIILKRRPDGREVVVAQGLHNPRGLALDRHGHLYVAEAAKRRVLKFLAPLAPTLDPVPPAFTTQATLTLHGTAVPGALVTVQGGAADATDIADPAGRFSRLLPLARNASNRLELYATAAGGDGLTSAPTSVTVVHDDMLPIMALTSPTPGAMVRGTIVVTATASDASGSGLGMVTFAVDGRTIEATNAPPFTTSLDTATLSDSPHTLSATARDRAGNEASASVGITTDNTPPTVAIPAPLDGGTVPTRTPELRVSYSDATTGVNPSTFRGILDGSDISATFAVSSAGATATVPTPLANGPHTLLASIADQAGNGGGKRSSVPKVPLIKV